MYGFDLSWSYLFSVGYFFRRTYENIRRTYSKDGYVLGENILKVDSFLTHQIGFER